jgi:hypothetical protein
MADFTVPGTWTYDGSANQNQSTYRVSGHTAQENYLVIFDRKVPVTNGDGTFSKPAVRVRIQRSFLDADSKPMSSKALVDTNITWPMEATASDVKAMVTLLGTIFGDAEIASDFVDDLVIPRPI